MKTRTSLLTVALLAAFLLLPAVAQADPITFTLDDSQAVSQGGSVTFFGTLANGGNPTRFLDVISIVINYAGPGTLTADDSPFFLLPLSLASGETTGLAAFFNVAASALVTPGTYTGSVTITLSADGTDPILVTQDFSIIVRQGQVIPEPATMFLLGSGLIGLAAAKRRRKRRQAGTP